MLRRYQGRRPRGLVIMAQTISIFARALSIILMVAVISTGTVAVVEAQSRPPGPTNGRGMYVPPLPRTYASPRTPSVPYTVRPPVLGKHWRVPPAPGPRLSPDFNKHAQQDRLRDSFNRAAGSDGDSSGGAGSSKPFGKPGAPPPPLPTSPAGPRFKPPGF